MQFHICLAFLNRDSFFDGLEFCAFQVFQEVCNSFSKVLKSSLSFWGQKTHEFDEIEM